MSDDLSAILRELKAIRAAIERPPELWTDKQLCRWLQIEPRTLRRYLAAVDGEVLPGAPMLLGGGDKPSRRWDPRTAPTFVAMARTRYLASLAAQAKPPKQEGDQSKPAKRPRTTTPKRKPCGSLDTRSAAKAAAARVHG